MKLQFRLALIISSLCILITSLAAQNHLIQYNLNELEGRKKFLIDSMYSWAKNFDLEDFKNSDDFNGGKYGAYPIMALFEKGDIEKARQFAAQQLVGGAAMFREFTTMALYMEYKELYDKELKQKVKEDQLNSNFYRPGKVGDLAGASENHKLMYASAAYLAGIEWPDEYPEKWFQAGYNHLMSWFDTVTSIGFWEEDSPTYLIHHMGPVLSVYEHAPAGSEMKNRAKMVLDWYFLSIAGEYLKGYWITPAARDYDPLYGVENSAETTVLTWLYFWDSNFIPYPHAHDTLRHWKSVIHFAVSDYELPEIIRKIATDRDKPYIHREYMARNPMHPKEYCYIRSHYGLASILHDNGNIPPDMTRWKVQWVPEKTGMEPSVFFMKHPIGDESKWKSWRGASPYEHVVQHKGTLLAVYDIPPGQLLFIDGPLNDKSFLRIEQEKDWLFLNAVNVFIGLRVANGLSMEDTKRDQDSHGQKMDIQVLKSSGRKNGLIVQTASPRDYKGSNNEESFNMFKEDILINGKPDFSGLNSKVPSITYIAPSGDELKVNANGQKEVNGKQIQFDKYPMFDNPWMHQEIDKQVLTLKKEGEKWIYDFNSWEIIKSK